MRGVETVVLLVALATVVAAFANRLRVSAPSLLVVIGLVVGLLPGAPAVHIPPDVVRLVVLPPLLYAASEELPWRDLRAVWRPVIVLAVGLVLASAAAVAAVTQAVAPVPASMAFVLGAVLASTDPVAVSALARRLFLPPRPHPWHPLPEPHLPLEPHPRRQEQPHPRLEQRLRPARPRSAQRSALPREPHT